MKILLIANARTGSTVLYKALSDILGLKRYGEPFNYGMRKKANTLIRKYPFPLQHNCIVKTLTRHIPEEFKSDEINFYDEWKRDFDKVILLARENLQDIYESQDFFRHIKQHWHQKYKYETPYTFRRELYKFINDSYDYIKWYSKKSHIPITWYEDLYSGDKEKIKKCIDNWEIDISVDDLYNYVNPEKRYRQFTKQTLI
jgi:hypothetical protein|tara:strand:- start:445 stop:1044 length:600 start_codon:yes stop_codon:yes gene_type:complete